MGALCFLLSFHCVRVEHFFHRMLFTSYCDGKMCGILCLGAHCCRISVNLPWGVVVVVRVVHVCSDTQCVNSAGLVMDSQHPLPKQCILFYRPVTSKPWLNVTINYKCTEL